MPGALEGLLVISVEQAVAAPYCAARLADAGARVIKIERPEGDFARAYDGYVHGQSSYFVWLNRGKQSVTLDFKDKDDLALLHRHDRQGRRADPEPGAGRRRTAGFGSAAMRTENKRLITVDISGYGEHGPYRDRRAYDLLVQAESGLASITGTGDGPGPGRHLGDRHRHRHVRPCRRAGGAARPARRPARAAPSRSRCSPPMAEWMTVPLLAKDYSDYDWPRLGLTHPFIAPYGVYQTADKVPVLISIQNDREFERLCHGVLDRPGPGEGSRLRHQQGAQCAARRHQRHRPEEFRQRRASPSLAARLDAAQIAWARVSSVDDLSSHPQLRRVTLRHDQRRRLDAARSPPPGTASPSGWATCRRSASIPSRCGASSRLGGALLEARVIPSAARDCFGPQSPRCARDDICFPHLMLPSRQACPATAPPTSSPPAPS